MTRLAAHLVVAGCFVAWIPISSASAQTGYPDCRSRMTIVISGQPVVSCVPIESLRFPSHIADPIAAIPPRVGVLEITRPSDLLSPYFQAEYGTQAKSLRIPESVRVDLFGVTRAGGSGHLAMTLSWVEVLDYSLLQSESGAGERLKLFYGGLAVEYAPESGVNPGQPSSIAYQPVAWPEILTSARGWAIEGRLDLRMLAPEGVGDAVRDAIPTGNSSRDQRDSDLTGDSSVLIRFEGLTGSLDGRSGEYAGWSIVESMEMVPDGGLRTGNWIARITKPVDVLTVPIMAAVRDVTRFGSVEWVARMPAPLEADVAYRVVSTTLSGAAVVSHELRGENLSAWVMHGDVDSAPYEVFEIPVTGRSQITVRTYEYMMDGSVREIPGIGTY